ncbi:cellulase family glycosylhydrolase [Luteococcus sp. Sow4_B9]|uniref:cellulase family glycosylhydrolase n=1 Tax=Luteococcus sp. Sow4_B9 TaxID=3438792 RepID=UPI003F9804AC
MFPRKRLIGLFLFLLPLVQMILPAMDADAATRRPPKSRVVTQGKDIGVCITGTDLLWSSRQDRIAQMDLLAASGARWLRVDIAASHFTWDNPTQYHWAHLDHVMALAEARNIQVLGILHQVPVYARPAGTPANHGPATSAERAAFARFGKTVAQRYQGRIAAYEIWNESNLQTFWSPRPNVSHYSQMLTATSAAIRQADPRATIVTGGTGGAGAAHDIPAQTWLKGMYQNTSRSAFDAVGFHAYPNMRDGSAGELAIFQQYRAVLDAHGDAIKPLWLTETGGATGSGALTTKQQSDAVKLAHTNWLKVKGRGPIFYYMLRDRPDGAENTFGLVTAAGKAKPAYRSLQGISTNPVARKQAAIRR